MVIYRGSYGKDYTKILQYVISFRRIGGGKMKLEDIKKLIKELETQGFDVFYTKGNDADSIKVYENKKQVIYINYNYSYIDIIEK